jgi:type III restriction enzyme
LLSGFSQSVTVFEFEEKKQSNRSQKDYFIKAFGINVVKKALCQFSEYKFSNLKIKFPHLKSLSEFITSDSYLGKVKVEVDGSEKAIVNLSQESKLDIVIRLLNKLSGLIQAENVEYKGTKEFKPFMVKETFIDKTLNIVNDGLGDKENGIAQSETTNQSLNMDLSKEDWFAFNENYGTSEEKYLVKYIAKVVNQLRQKYSEVYLLRNERHFKLYNFDDGRVFEPDFVLFLVKNDKKLSLHYQVFIEPKGGHLIKNDEWKHLFLMQLKKQHKIEQLWKDKQYIVWGMPFYNETDTKTEFEKEFSILL